MMKAWRITIVTLVSFALNANGSRVNQASSASLQAEVEASRPAVSEGDLHGAVDKCKDHFKDNLEDSANCVCSLAGGDDVKENEMKTRCNKLTMMVMTEGWTCSSVRGGCCPFGPKFAADGCKDVWVPNPQACKGHWDEGKCDKECGDGHQVKTYHVDSPSVEGGAECPAADGKTHKTTCKIKDCKNNCFPGDATVETLSGRKQMSDLRVGDAVRSVDAAGKTFFDDVYFFGHADASSHLAYVSLKLEGTQESLQLSARHFLPTCPEQGQPCEWGQHTTVYAREVQVGDHIWIADGEEIALKRVKESSTTIRQGLYNPYTLSGKIVVNGVLASAHSDWVLDDWTPSSLTQFLPSVYQAMFLPGRWLYKAVGSAAADALDVNNPQTAPEKHGYGPKFLAACAIVSVMIIVASLPKRVL